MPPSSSPSAVRAAREKYSETRETAWRATLIAIHTNVKEVWDRGAAQTDLRETSAAATLQEEEEEDDAAEAERLAFPLARPINARQTIRALLPPTLWQDLEDDIVKLTRKLAPGHAWFAGDVFANVTAQEAFWAPYKSQALENFDPYAASDRLRAEPVLLKAGVPRAAIDRIVNSFQHNIQGWRQAFEHAKLEEDDPPGESTYQQLQFQTHAALTVLERHLDPLLAALPGIGTARQLQQAILHGQEEQRKMSYKTIRMTREWHRMTGGDEDVLRAIAILIEQVPDWRQILTANRQTLSVEALEKHANARRFTIFNAVRPQIDPRTGRQKTMLVQATGDLVYLFEPAWADKEGAVGDPKKIVDIFKAYEARRLKNPKLSSWVALHASVKSFTEEQHRWASAMLAGMTDLRERLGYIKNYQEHWFQEQEPPAVTPASVRQFVLDRMAARRVVRVVGVQAPGG